MKYLTTLIFLGYSMTLWASSEKSKIYVDFDSMYIYSKGVYTPPHPKKHDLDPIIAEVNARGNGIANVKKYFDNTCERVNKSSVRIKPQFKKAFRSEGTEIYSNGLLEVNLRASYDSIVQAKRTQEIKTSSGERIVFSLPSKISADSLLCGTPAFEFNNDLNQNLRIHLVPAKIQKSLSEKEKLIKLKFNEEKQAFTVTNIKDAELVKKIKIKYSQNGETFLPVTVYSH